MRLAQIRLGVGAHLLQDHRADLRRAVLLAHHLDPGVAILRAHDLVGDEAAVAVYLGVVIFAPHEALDREDRVLGVRDRLPLRHLADEALAALGERDDGGGRATALRAGDDDRLAAFHHRDAAIRRPQVNANYLCPQ